MPDLSTGRTGTGHLGVSVLTSRKKLMTLASIYLYLTVFHCRLCPSEELLKLV